MAESIAQTQTRLTQFIQEVNPSADVSPGSALSELVIKLAATLDNQIYNQITTYSQSSSVQTALASTVPTTTPAIDEVASNFRVSRFAGTFANGNLKIVLSVDQDVLVSQGAQFIQSNLNLTYATTQQYSFSANSTNANGKLPIVSLPNGTFYIIVPVQASAVGSQFQVSDQTQFTAGSNFTNKNVVTIAAYGNFSSGLPADTDQMLIPKFQSGTSNGNLYSEAGINNYLMNNIPGYQTVSVIGANDPEMVRSKENLFGIATNGMADVYVRTSVGASTLIITKQGTKVSTGVWQVNMLNTDIPGFYSVKGILPTPVNNATNSAGSLVINSTTFGYSQLANQRNNQINSVADARFTSYQTATILFQYNESPAVANGTAASFDLNCFYQPSLLPIQQVFLNDATRPPNADYLVKAVVPCFCTVQLTLAKLNATDTATTIGIPQLQQDIYNYINTLGFNSPVAASEIIKLCHNYPIQRVELPILLTGNIFTINGTNEMISSNDELVIPVDIPNGISPNTTLFFIDYFTATSGNVTPNNNIIINLA